MVEHSWSLTKAKAKLELITEEREGMEKQERWKAHRPRVLCEREGKGEGLKYMREPWSCDPITFDISRDNIT